MLEVFKGIHSIKRAANDSAIYAASPLKETLLHTHSGVCCGGASAMDDAVASG
jgi:hypothetical protein